MDQDYVSQLVQKDIQVTTEDYNFTDVPAFCSKYLAIHLTVDAGTPPEEQKYSVTHITTGCCISNRVMAVPLDCAIALMKSLEDIDCWSFSQIDGLMRMTQRKSAQINLAITNVLKEHNLLEEDKKLEKV